MKEIPPEGAWAAFLQPPGPTSQIQSQTASQGASREVTDYMTKAEVAWRNLLWRSLGAATFSGRDVVTWSSL